MNPLVVLGVTGSIGRQTLEVASRLDVPIRAVGARRGSKDLHHVARQHPDTHVVVAHPLPEERERFAADFGNRVAFGPEALSAAAALPGSTVVNAVVGSAGLPASVAALEAGNRLALANKESLVAGGPLMMAARERGGGELIPVDSEHSALWQCLAGERAGSVRRVILTASGGPFRGRSADELAAVTPEQALRHPTWAMGNRITIDSATLMNKAFEVIEAHYLFDLSYDAIDVTVHPQSIVHSFVEFRDGSVKAQLGDPDMRVPIQYAITYPERSPAPVPPFDPAASALTFEAPDRAAFPCLDLGYEAGRRGGSAPAVLNAADEVAVHAFLQGDIGFATIPIVVAESLQQVEWRPLDTAEDALTADAEARVAARTIIGSSC
jgi:1-deoxy-D-xylulose-5-phosphate reductoisomerase